MVEAKHGIVAAPHDKGGAELRSQLNELGTGFKNWLSTQPFGVEAGIVTTLGAAQGATIGGFMGLLRNDVSTSLLASPKGGTNMGSLKGGQVLSGGPATLAYNFAVLTGVNAGISCIMKKIRGKDDIETSMLAAFGSGAMFSLVSGLGGSNPIGHAVNSGFFFAIGQAGLYKLGERFSESPKEYATYSKTRSMLNNLGLQNYEKHFKNGLITDSTLPLLTDSILKDVHIPPGPRLLILDHIQRDPELRQSKEES